MRTPGELMSTRASPRLLDVLILSRTDHIVETCYSQDPLIRAYRSFLELLHSLLTEFSTSQTFSEIVTPIRRQDLRMKKNMFTRSRSSATATAKCATRSVGKGAGLAEMSKAGVPSRPGFTISTEVCTLFFENKNSVRKK